MSLTNALEIQDQDVQLSMIPNTCLALRTGHLRLDVSTSLPLYKHFTHRVMLTVMSVAYHVCSVTTLSQVSNIGLPLINVNSYTSW